MKQVKIIIGNDSKMSGTIIETIESSFEAATQESAVGKAMGFAQSVINKQYDAPTVNIDGVELSSAMCKKFKLDFFAFRIEFGKIRETILAQTAFESAESMVSYIRRTDRNGVFTGVNKFTEQQVAAQAKEQLRLVSDLTKWVKEDAKSSVVPTEVMIRRQLQSEAAKAKRLAAKAQAALNA